MPVFDFYTHNDQSKWGKRFKEEADELGYSCKIFDDINEVPAGSKCFVRLDQKKGQRSLSKNIVIDLNKNLHCKTIPSAEEAYYYDDKLAQFPFFRRWLPRTEISKDKKDALQLIDHMEYPFIHKSHCGSSSKGVRLVKNKDQAHDIVSHVFSEQGMHAGMYDRVQKNYIYWQQFLPNNPCDYRVIICGKYLFGIIRHNRPDVPFASGSGDFESFSPALLDRETLQALRARKSINLCLEVAHKIKTKWMAFDVVFDKHGTPYLLEVSSSWSPWIYKHCPVWEITSTRYPATIKPVSKYGGADMFKMAVETLGEME